jgi:glycosyltransferase involved in cell wall biosynthesis
VSELLTPPFWGGSEQLWFDAVMRADVRALLSPRVAMRRSPVTNERAAQLEAQRVSVDWIPYDPVPATIWHRGLILARGGIESLRGVNNTERWWRRILGTNIGLVLFNLAGASNILTIAPAVAACDAACVPYAFLFQHVHENLLWQDDKSVDQVIAIASRAGACYFVSLRNRHAFETSLGTELVNARRVRNSLTKQFLASAGQIAERRTESRPDATLNLLSLARLDPAFKGQHLLLQALARPRWAGRDWHLTLKGGGRLRRFVERLVAHTGHDPRRVAISAQTDDVRSSLARADVCVMPSLSEGMPFALLECMAAGMPAVGTPVAGIPEVVVDGRTGWLAHSATLDELDDALERCWQSRPEHYQLGMAAAELVQRDYRQDDVLPEFARELRGLAGARQVVSDPTEREPIRVSR